MGQSPTFAAIALSPWGLPLTYLSDHGVSGSRSLLSLRAKSDRQVSLAMALPARFPKMQRSFR
jgi:hypothetical protein